MTRVDVRRAPRLFPGAVIAAVSQLAGNRQTAGHMWWGGWGSNPRPADYESSPPAAVVGPSDLGSCA
jgi:hypothetical protein